MIRGGHVDISILGVSFTYPLILTCFNDAAGHGSFVRGRHC